MPANKNVRCFAIVGTNIYALKSLGDDTELLVYETSSETIHTLPMGIVIDPTMMTASDCLKRLYLN